MKSFTVTTELCMTLNTSYTMYTAKCNFCFNFNVDLFLQDPVVRTLCLSETCIIERDPATYIIVSCHPLSDVGSS